MACIWNKFGDRFKESIFMVLRILIGTGVLMKRIEDILGHSKINYGWELKEKIATRANITRNFFPELKSNRTTCRSFQSGMIFCSGVSTTRCFTLSGTTRRLQLKLGLCRKSNLVPWFRCFFGCNPWFSRFLI